ncbi:MAG: DUF6941 family protein [Limisphaerales bacterium]
MTSEIFALCDAATVSGGKLNLLGAFDSIHAAQMPAVHAQCAVAARLRFMRIEEGQHRIKLNVVNEDGRPIMPSIDGVLTVNFGVDDESAVTNFIVNIHQLKFEKLGQYSIDLAVDGRHEASLPLFVKAMPTPAVPPSAGETPA